ncbi:hypothetical protein ACI3PL_09595, partial [Lacticaseibacillus paracasei]
IPSKSSNRLRCRVLIHLSINPNQSSVERQALQNNCVVKLPAFLKKFNKKLNNTLLAGLLGF